jgi:predicted TIM-barrel fold metal-dependent hydrolase
MGKRAIDCWVNVAMGELGKPEYLVEVAKRYFKQGDEFFRNYSIDEMLEQMDALGVERAILTTVASRPQQHVLSFAEKHPDRFGLGIQLDPSRKIMKQIREWTAFAADYPLVLVRVTPFGCDLPPTDPRYYPIYTKCVELDLPITINTGIPGPPAPGECQNPMYLDRVCLDFPDLKLCMAHGADPWWDIACRLMLKYPNLHLMTSAYMPKYLPESFVHFMNTRGKDKVIFASDHPAIQMKRCLEDARSLELRPGILDKYLYQNAKRLFFPESLDSGS